MGTTARGVCGQTPASDMIDESMSPMLHSKVRVGLPIVSRKPTSPVKGKGTGSRSAARIKERFHVCDYPVPIPTPEVGGYIVSEGHRTWEDGPKMSCEKQNTWKWFLAVHQEDKLQRLP